MDNPLLSVIIPIYNTEELIDRCINSIVQQTYTNLDIICINDGSTDKSKDKIEKWEKKDQRIRTYHTKNGGVAQARNIGLSVARGDYIGWVDSDDWIEKEYFSKMMDAIKKYNTKVVVSTKSMKNDSIYHKDKILEEFFLGHITRTLWSTVILKEIYNDNRFKNYQIGEDTLMLFNVLKQTDSLAVISNDGYHYELRDESVVHNISIEKYNDWIDVYLEMHQSVCLDNKSFIPLCSYRLIREMDVIYNKIKESPLHIKRKIMKRMRSVYFRGLLDAGIYLFSPHRIKKVIRVAKHLMFG